MAKMPGEIPGMSWPVSLPKNAPASLERCQTQGSAEWIWLEELLKTYNEGMMIPLGTLMPNVTMVRMSLVSVP